MQIPILILQVPSFILYSNEAACNALSYVNHMQFCKVELQKQFIKRKEVKNKIFTKRDRKIIAEVNLFIAI
jgi:hypothetical protein